MPSGKATATAVTAPHHARAGIRQRPSGTGTTGRALPVPVLAWPARPRVRPSAATRATVITTSTTLSAAAGVRSKKARYEVWMAQVKVSYRISETAPKSTRRVRERFAGLFAPPSAGPSVLGGAPPAGECNRAWNPGPCRSPGTSPPSATAPH